MGRGFKYNFFQREVQLVNRHMHRCLTLPSIKEVKIKTTMRYSITPDWLLSKRKKNVGKDVEKREPFCTVSRKINWYSYYGKPFDSSQNFKNRTAILSSNTTSAYLSKKNENILSKRYLSNGILFNHKKMENLPFLTTWINIEGIMLSKVSQKKDR